MQIRVAGSLGGVASAGVGATGGHVSWHAVVVNGMGAIC